MIVNSDSFPETAYRDLRAGDSVRFWYHGEPRTALVLRYLVFADHVQVRLTPFGYTVNDENFIKVVRRRR